MLFRSLPINFSRLCRLIRKPEAAAQPQNYTRRLSEKQSFSANRAAKPQKLALLSVLALCLCVSAVNLSCSSKPTDLRTLVPADTLVYLETNDLAAALQPIVDGKPFTQVAHSKPNFSALKRVKVAVAVTGFETTEEKLTEEHSVGRVKPRFVAIIDANLWDSQAVLFAETKLNEIVQEMLGGDAKGGRSQRSRETGGTYITWGSNTGLAHALILDGLIYFSNDESAIDKCLAVRRGEADSIAKSGKVKPADPKTLAAGYVSTDGVAQIASILGMQFAAESSDEPEIQSAIAGILPQLIRNSITEVSWTTAKTDEGIEDKYLISMPSDIAVVFAETMAPGDESATAILSQLPVDTVSLTAYNVKKPQIAWRSVVLTAQKLIDPIAGKMIVESSALFFEPYGVRDPETFLSSVGSSIVTARFDLEGEQPVVFAKANEPAKIKESFASDIRRLKDPSPTTNSDPTVEQWRSEDGDLAAAFAGSWVIVGDAKSVGRCLDEKPDGGFGFTPFGRRMNASRASVTTFSRDTTTILSLINLLAREGHGDTKADSNYITETRFTKTGIDRRTVSDFGLIGSIIAQLDRD